MTTYLSVQFSSPSSFKIISITIFWTEVTTLLTSCVSVAVVSKWYFGRLEDWSWLRNFLVRKSLK